MDGAVVEGRRTYRIASTRLNCIAFFRSGWRKCVRAFFFFLLEEVEPWSFLRYLRALADWVAARACWRSGVVGFEFNAKDESRGVRRVERHDGQ